MKFDANRAASSAASSRANPEVDRVNLRKKKNNSVYRIIRATCQSRKSSPQFHFHIPAPTRLKPDPAKRHNPPTKICRLYRAAYNCACVIMARNASNANVDVNVTRYGSECEIRRPNRSRAACVSTSQISENRSAIKRSTLVNTQLTNVVV